MPRKCTVCSHKKFPAISKEIGEGKPYRAIALKFKVGVQSMYRHIENCLSLELAAIVEQRKEQGAIDVYEEFEKNLDFARRLRVSAEEYLTDPLDPLKIAITPFAHEITVSYFDHTEVGENGKPTKKTAPLSNLLNAVGEIGKMIASSDANIDGDWIMLKILEIDKVSIKHVDLRSFATDCIRTVDQCVDRFAKLRGMYQKPRENEEQAKRAVEAIREYLQRFPNSDVDQVVDTFAKGRQVPREQIMSQLDLGAIG